jgi:hypothetical protein
MPNRIVRDGILTSERVDMLSEAEELFFRRLMSVVDDYGKYSANPKLLLSACYPLRTTTKTLAEINLYLAACEEVGLLKIYKIKETAFLELIDFRQRLRVMVSKWPGQNGRMTLNGQTDDGQASDGCLADDGHMTDGCLTDDGSRARNPNPNPNPKSSRREENRNLSESEGEGARSPLPFGEIKEKILAVAGERGERQKPDEKDPFVTPLILEKLQKTPGYLRLDVSAIAREAAARCQSARMKRSFLVQALDWERERAFKENGDRSAAEGAALKAEQARALENGSA